jgi:hypothetical protein
VADAVVEIEMKKLFILIIFFILLGCIKPDRVVSPTYTRIIDNQGMLIKYCTLEIEGHEYLVSTTHGGGDVIGAHKANCKFCGGNKK